MANSTSSVCLRWIPEAADPGDVARVVDRARKSLPSSVHRMPDDPSFIPVGPSQESRNKGLIAMDAMMRKVDDDVPSRTSDVGLRIPEIHLAADGTSLVR